MTGKGQAMNLLYQWLGSILCFLIFITMASALLPSKKYEKYIRFFAGMVLILLVVQPLTGSLRLEDRIAYYFEAISFQKESQDLSRQILGIENERLVRVIAEYEHAVEQDVANMAADMGFVAEEVKVTIENDQEKENYGTVTHVFMQVAWEEEGGEKENEEAGKKAVSAVDEISIDAVEVEEIEIGEGEPGSEEGRQQGDKTLEEGQPGSDAAGGLPEPSELEAASRNTEATESLRKLRRKVERYYGLESKEVEIELKVR